MRRKHTSCFLWLLYAPVGGGPPARSPHASLKARSDRSRGPPWPYHRPPAPQPPSPSSPRAALQSGRRPPAPLHARTTGSKRDKTLPARHKTLILACFTRAGRVLSRHPSRAWATPRIRDDQPGASHRNESHDGHTRIGYLDPDMLISYPDALNHCCDESDGTHARPATINRRVSRAGCFPVAVSSSPFLSVQQTGVPGGAASPPDTRT